VSKEARYWIKEHNHKVKKGALKGVRIISCYLPTKSPWLNAMEPKWILIGVPSGGSASSPFQGRWRDLGLEGYRIVGSRIISA